MTLRGKLLLAQIPLLAALIAVAVAGGAFTTKLGRGSQAILKDNYRSVLAAQRMKESLERMDSAALFVVAGERARASEQSAGHRRHFEAELAAQEGNITEPGEREATDKLRVSWAGYLKSFDKLVAKLGDAGDPALGKALYFNDLYPRFLATKDAADVILAMNQDAMLRKSDQAQRLADHSVTMLALVSIAGFVLAAFASTALTGRLLRPLSVLGQAARRIGEGDLAARAAIGGSDEIAQLAAEFNGMGERIQKYRQSSLGELLEAQQSSQAAIDSLPDPVLVLGVGGELLHVNRAAEAILKISVEKTGLAGLDPAVRTLVEKVHHHVAAGKGGFSPRGLDEATRLVTSEGDRFLLPRATPVYAEEGDVTGTTIILQDVTRLLRFEELRNNVVATVAHEFRTPLTSLRMAIHLLIERAVGQMNEKHADLVFAAREDCERLQSIVDELLDLSRIQAGRIELRRVPLDAEAVVKTAADGQRAAAVQRQIQLLTAALPGPKASVDPERIQLVFTNLLANAIRHSPPGGTVVIGATVEGAWVRFEVSDQGPGIPKEYQQAIFEKYFQVPGPPSGGAGLGLFICKEVVHAHDGQIGVESQPGKGSTFWVKLPLARERAAPT